MTPYILREIGKRKANWIGHILRRNCLLKQVIEEKIQGEMEVTRRRGRRRRKLLDDLKDGRGYSHLKEEALDSTMWRNRFGGSFESVVTQNTEWMMMNTRRSSTLFTTVALLTVTDVMNPEHTVPFYSFKTCFSIAFPSVSGSSKWSPFLKLFRPQPCIPVRTHSLIRPQTLYKLTNWQRRYCKTPCSCHGRS